MSEPSMPKWKQFEQLAKRILEDVAGNAAVKWDDRISGRLSGCDRQIDVSVRWIDEDMPRLLIVQAKDWKNASDITVIDEFASVMRDVGADAGVLICASGFSATSVDYARNLGIHLYNLHDAESLHWDRQLTIPVLWVDLHPRTTVWMQGRMEAGDELEMNKKHGYAVSTDAGKTLVDFTSEFESAWNSGHLDRRAGRVHHLTVSKHAQAQVRTKTGTLIWRDLEACGMSYVVEEEAWLGQFLPAECRGLVDALDSNAFTATHVPIGEVPTERDESWVKVADADAVAVRLRGTFVTTEKFEVEVGSASYSDPFAVRVGD